MTKTALAHNTQLYKQQTATGTTIKASTTIGLHKARGGWPCHP